MGERVSRQPSVMEGAVAGATLSSIATIIQLAVVIGLIESTLLRALMLPLIFGGLAASLYGLVFLCAHTQPAVRTLAPRMSAERSS